MSFLDLELPDQELNEPVFVLGPEDQEMNITLPPNVRVGPDDVHTAYVSNRYEIECWRLDSVENYTCTLLA